MLQKFYKKIIIAILALTFYTGTTFNTIHAACFSEQPAYPEPLSSTNLVTIQTPEQAKALDRKPSHAEFKQQFSNGLEQALDQIRKGLWLKNINDNVAQITLASLAGLSLLEATTGYLTTPSSYVKCALPIAAGGCLTKYALNTKSEKLLYAGVEKLLEFETKATTSKRQRYLKKRLSHFTVKELEIIDGIRDIIAKDRCLKKRTCLSFC